MHTDHTLSEQLMCNVPLDCHLGDESESCQAINCTGTAKQTNNDQNTHKTYSTQISAKN